MAEILERGNVDWSHEATCPMCQSVIRYGVEDLVKVPAGSDQRENVSWPEKFYVRCPVCEEKGVYGSQTNFKKEEIPAFVRALVRTKAPGYR